MNALAKVETSSAREFVPPVHGADRAALAIEAARMRDLWAAVLLTQWNEAFDIGDGRMTHAARMAAAAVSRGSKVVAQRKIATRRDAQRWFATRGCRDICELAGVEFEFIQRKFNEMIVADPSLDARNLGGF